MPKLFIGMTSEQANLCALVLSSAGIPYLSAEGGTGWEIWVKEADVEAALAAVQRYFRENPEEAPSHTGPGEPPPRTMTGVWAGLLLAAIYLAVTANRSAPLFMDTFAGSSERILSGEAYRAVTSLMLHADWVHLAGNVVGIVLFGTAICMVTGPAADWLMILLSGAIGNAANALLYRADDVSIGASTAVFGAVGILSACQFWRRRQHAQHRIKAWLPLAGGLALLAILGAGGQRVDVMAHLFGLLSGLLLGMIYCIRVDRPLARSGQVACWSATAVILAAGWLRLV